MRVTRYAPKIAGWPSQLKLRIVMLTDFHACEPFMNAKRVAAICAQANGLGGDLIVLLGDYLSGPRFSTPPKGQWAAPLKALSAPLGVHAVLGNHDYNHQPNLNLLIGRLNQIREEHPALQQLRDVHIHDVRHDQILAFSKVDGADVILTVCSLDPDNAQECELSLDLDALGAAGKHQIKVTDELTRESYYWGERAYVRLYPGLPAHILHVTAE